jgi:hypothetical protein
MSKMSKADKKRQERLNKIREKVRKKKGERSRDPDEWRPPKLDQGTELKAKAYVLPPLEHGETCSSGKAIHGMDGVYFIQVGDHWINNKKYPCPRVYDNEQCPVCTLGFELLKDTVGKDARSELAKAWLPQTRFCVNLYFPNVSSNSEDVRGQVKFYSMPATMFDKTDACLNRDDAGDDADDPQAWGEFYDEADAYPFLVHITKNGQYNDYKSCKFLVNARGPIAKSESEIEAILAMRHDLVAKFPARDSDNFKALEKIVDGVLAAADDDDDGDGDGFDADETTAESVNETKVESKPEPAKEKPKPQVKLEETEAEETTTEDDIELKALLEDIKTV